MWRVRVEGELLVLQVREFVSDEPHYYGGYTTTGKQVWRDAKVQDIPVFDPFKEPKPDNYMSLPDPTALDGWKLGE